MCLYKVKFAEHVLGFYTESEWVKAYIKNNYRSALMVDEAGDLPDLFVFIQDGYGVPFIDYQVDVASNSEKIVYNRADYRLEVDPAYYKACISVYDDFALKHAMVNLYSAFIIRRNWGLLIHSSCMVEREKAYMFAGHSGAGKSTVVELSAPRPILSDEATIVKLDSQGAWIFTSPFRSDTEMPGSLGEYPLASVQMLRQSPYNKRTPLTKLEAVQQMMQRVFFWAHDAEETKKMFRLCMQLIVQVPVYELYFQKNNTFWEEIS